MQKRKRLAVDIDIFELISKYRDNECLWDYSNKDYKNKSLKKKVWERIAQQFGTEMTLVKNKVRFLRTAYVSEKNKVDKAKRLGETPYTPGLFYYKYLTFLDDVVICRKTEDELELDKTHDLECDKAEISRDSEENIVTEHITKTEQLDIEEYALGPTTQVSPIAEYGGFIDVIELISKYKDCECLWNYHSEHYKHKDKRQRAWESIAKHFEKEVAEVKTKVRRLRTAFVSEKRKLEQSKKHKPTLFYYNHLNFLDGIVVCRSGADDLEKTNDLEQSNLSEKSNDSDFDNMLTNDEYFSKTEDIKESLGTNSTPSSTSSQQIHYSPPPPVISSARSLRCESSKQQSELDLKCSIAVKDVNASSRKKSKLNVYNSFGTTIALQLEQLPLDVATITMSEIHTLITKKLLDYFKSLHNGHQSRFDMLQPAINDTNI